MSTCESKNALRCLDLPNEFEDLTGLIQTDLKAIVLAVSERASERLLLTRRESKQLRQNLWNRLTQSLNETMAPLSAENR
jgi:hypothetical protein